MPKITLENGKVVDISKESYEEFSKAVRYERVPECIEIEVSFYDDQFYLNNNNESLYCDNGNKCISNKREDWIIKNLILVPCKREDLKCGDVAFKTDYEDMRQKNTLSSYCVIKNDTTHVYWSNSNICESNYEYIHWYKVQLDK